MKKFLFGAGILILISSATYTTNALGKNKDADLIRRFHESIINSDYVTAAKCGCETQEAIKNGDFGIGPDEISFFQEKYKWNGLKLIQIKELAGFYELKLERKSGISVQNISLGNEQGVDCIYLMK